MNKIAAILLMLLLPFAGAGGADISPTIATEMPDSCRTEASAPLVKPRNFWSSSAAQAVGVGLPLIGAGIAVKSADHRFEQYLDGSFPQVKGHDWHLQLLPAATMLGMKALGVKSRTPWGQMLVADALSVGIMAGTVELVKHSVDEMRPDGSDTHAFPSGHTATAFMTASMLHHEYGERYPWLSVAGYGVATATGFMRIHDYRHWLGDVMAGAGIGIVSTELGYLLSDLIFRRPLLDDVSEAVGDDFRPSFASYYVSVNIPLGGYGMAPGTDFDIATGCTTGMEGAWFITENLGVGGRLAYSEAKFYTDGDCAQRAPLRYATSEVGVYGSKALTDRLLLGGKIAGGAGRYYSLTLTDGRQAGKHFKASTVGAFGTGVSLTMRVREGFAYQLYCDYDLLTARAAGAGALSTLGIGARAIVNF